MAAVALVVMLIVNAAQATLDSLAASEKSSRSSRFLLAKSDKVNIPDRQTIKVKLHDLDLIDQDGNSVKFKSDIIGDRVAVIIPFYTTCTTAYPILVFIFTRLQVLLGERLGKDVVLISLTVDPRTDIPIRLKAFARRQKARPGWVFLTGERNNLGKVLWGTGAILSANLEEHDHIPITLVGRAGGQWRRFHGFPTPEQLLGQVEKELATREQS
ncbi:MAG: SCO family protein [Desulfobacterales bacterium]|nr:MAG: SCO family protein [Desulfobacterales bacterium]